MEGRERAKLVAIQRRQQTKELENTGNDANNDSGEGNEETLGTDNPVSEAKDRKRHGARNQDRHKKFTRWILQRFGHLLHVPPTTLSDDPILSPTVLEVAGGKGELTARLSICHKIRVVICDPRKSDVAKCFEEVVFRSLPNKWQQGYQQKSTANPNFIHEEIDQYVHQLVMRFDEYTVSQCKDLEDAVKKASLLIGMHADGATEDIVNIALRYNKPFVVVPCCVFPKLFAHRILVEDDGKEVPVRTHDQFCRYLHRKHDRFVVETLPFDGRNIAVWWDGKQR